MKIVFSIPENGGNDIDSARNLNHRSKMSDYRQGPRMSLYENKLMQRYPSNQVAQLYFITSPPQTEIT